MCFCFYLTVVGSCFLSIQSAATLKHAYLQSCFGVESCRFLCFNGYSQLRQVTGWQGVQSPLCCLFSSLETAKGCITSHSWHVFLLVLHVCYRCLCLMVTISCSRRQGGRDLKVLPAFSFWVESSQGIAQFQFLQAHLMHDLLADQNCTCCCFELL